MLDNIEANLNDANDYLEKAEKHLMQAKKWHEKTRTVKYLPNINVENVLCFDLLTGRFMCIVIWSIQSLGLVFSLSQL
jgi:hypothetical protein